MYSFVDVVPINGALLPLHIRDNTYFIKEPKKKWIEIEPKIRWCTKYAYAQCVFVIITANKKIFFLVVATTAWNSAAAVKLDCVLCARENVYVSVYNDECVKISFFSSFIFFPFVLLQRKTCAKNIYIKVKEVCHFNCYERQILFVFLFEFFRIR